MLVLTGGFGLERGRTEMSREFHKLVPEDELITPRKKEPRRLSLEEVNKILKRKKTNMKTHEKVTENYNK